jgi:antitoxin ParD1/3/4
MDSRKLSVALSGDQVAALKDAVAAGEYATTSAIIREAIRDWQVKRALTPDEVAGLRRLWDDGKASGAAGPIDFDDLRREARARVSRGLQGAG